MLADQSSDDSAYALPEAFISSRMESAFASYDVGVWEDAPSCKKVRPGPALHPSPIIAGRNYTYKEVVKGSRGEIPMRAGAWAVICLVAPPPSLFVGEGGGGVEATPAMSWPQEI